MIDESLYYEIHVTIEPQGIGMKDFLVKLGKENGDFRLATLLMRKGDEVEYEDDQFFTSRRKTFDDSVEAVIAFCLALHEQNLEVKRYKIEDTRMDSKIIDHLGLCG